MRHVISSLESVGQKDSVPGRCEVCAVAEADYDEKEGRMTVRLKSFLRPIPTREGAGPFREDWLPPDQTVRSELDFNEADPMARDIFRSWVSRVRSAAKDPGASAGSPSKKDTARGGSVDDSQTETCAPFSTQIS